MKTAHLVPTEPIAAAPVSDRPIGENPTLSARTLAPISDPPSVRRPTPVGHAAGEVLAGKYQLVGYLGEGGMGTVWRAHSLPLDVDVAIKVLNREHADGHASERLLREARATARLGHPAIVRVFDFGETDAGEPFLVMELLEGKSLADWLDRGRMPASLAVQLLLPVASGLAAAHAQGIVHRDIKPENIIVVGDGNGTYLPKLLDFGIAKLKRRGGHVLTEVGVVLGSLEYMSPEQADGTQEVDEQTDVWALSVVLYELVTGQRPFEGATPQATILALFSGTPTPTTELAAGDEELWQIIERGLRKSPSERWPTMRALGQALASWAIERGITADTAGTSLAHHWLGTPSRPPGDDPNAPISIVRTIIGPPRARESSPSLSSLDVPSDAPSQRDSHPGRRRGTIELAFTRGARVGASPAPRRTKALFVAGFLAVLVLPLLFAAGSYVRGAGGIASASAGVRPAEPLRDAPVSMTATPPAAASSDVRPAPVEAPRGAAGEDVKDQEAKSEDARSEEVKSEGANGAPPARRPGDQRAAPAIRRRLALPAMPLPGAPNY